MLINDKILQYINTITENVKVTEKNKYGEVYTPLSLIQEHLSEMPPDVFKNPKLRWLEPAAGIASYPIVAYHLLMDGLKSVIRDEKKRSKHIITKMLYMIEINIDNVKIIKHLFKMIDKNAKVNIVHGDFLSLDIEKYDIIMGNPPFQISRGTEIRKGLKGRRTLWNGFVKKSLDMLNPDGYLVFITPQLWRKPEYDLLGIIIPNYQVHYLKIFNREKSKEIFKVGTRTDTYIIQKTPYKSKTKIIDEHGTLVKLDFREWPFIANSSYEKIKQILSDKSEDSIKVIYSASKYDSRRLNHEKTSEYKYPIIHTQNKHGNGILWAKNKDSGQFTSKVILNFNVKLYPYLDYKGEYGMSQISFGLSIKNKKEGELIIKALETPAFKQIILDTKWTTFQTEWRMFKYFKRDFYFFFLNPTNQKEKPLEENEKPLEENEK